MYLIQNNIFMCFCSKNRPQTLGKTRKKIKIVNRVNQNFRAIGLKYAALEPPL